ncbi:hypothetical protein ACUVF2_005070, partial [Escherichia coli]
RTNNRTKIKFELKVKNYKTTSYTTNSDSASPPIMIGRCKDNTNKNRKLAVSAGHRPDGEETKKDTQRSRGSRVTQKPAYAGFLFFP